MVTYQIQIPEANQEAFLKIMQSLKSLGVVDAFNVSDKLAQPGTAMSEEDLLAILQESEIQADKGLVVPAKDVIAFMQSWKKSK